MKNALRQMIREDIGFEDITTNALIDHDMHARAEILSREKGVIAGVDVAEMILADFDLDYSVNYLDGDTVTENDIIISIEGNVRSILSVERTILNLMMRMSGIATLTAKMVNKALQANPDIIIAATRKTTPGIQFFEKQAVKAGGGDTHRFRLDDCVMVKDNHIAAVGNLKAAIDKAKKNVSFTKKIEVEVESLGDAILAAQMGVDIIMLDNMSPEDIKKILNELVKLDLRENVIIEASGRINPDNMVDYALSGVDVISMGFITHSAPILDLSLELIQIG
ncbi:carboxylating nicotinate-nucleotide diphosphorylase [Methanobacterium alcaliphilum]|uniref:carboxylating nicotinate-nucleotide diphosphorylase n=1 Tax=Methanobacterium alcaliphilum TaxID=392018 RepID=UPI00200B4B8C|nr:carboxylating nicotinate-nucleotide diphosphorylase [Methanobacterium alcaliphilum]MCK9151223.1 carboxylating nicotinate-nucleotide diphosphorylase [Methanobacterium alcaliphilum]